MIPLTLAEIAEAVGGELAGADPATVVTGGVEYDSRRVGPGGLFLAFGGERVDGHDFGPAAIAAGAVAVLGTRALSGVPTVLVTDALAATGRLAAAVRRRLPDLTVVGVTGSSGKTTTKDLLAAVLADGPGRVIAPAGSLNNELGAPYTLLRADASTRVVVLEMGARGTGHITYLCEIARPDVAVVVNVGVAHIGEFGSVDAIADAKAELVRALRPDGLAVLNADDPRVAAMAGQTGARVVLVGEAPGADVRATDVSLDDRGRAAFTLSAGDFTGPVRLAVAGRHQVGNALLAAAVAIGLGATPEQAASRLGGATLASSRRMEVVECPGGVTLVDDSYNANPSSTAAALRALAAMGAGGAGAGAGRRRTFAVLGYMAELGEYERAGHEDVGRVAAELGVDHLIAVGEQAAPICDGAGRVPNWGGKSVLVTDQQSAVALLRERLRPGDLVLVKGSRYRTWQVADALRAGDHGDGSSERGAR